MWNFEPPLSWDEASESIESAGCHSKGSSDHNTTSFFLSQYNIHAPSTNVLHIHWNGWRRVFHWNGWRRVFRRTHTGTMPPAEDELLGPSAFALFRFRFGPVSYLHSQILRSLATLNFRPSVCNFLCLKIRDYTIGFAAARTGPPYPSMVIFANLNFIEKLYVDVIHRPPVSSQFRQLDASGLVDETFVLRTSTEDWGGADDEEGAEEDNIGASDSAIEMLRRRKLERRGGEEESCSICLETFSDGEEVIPLQCEHVYHESCIVTWLKKSQSCPLCRPET